jgi:hypothetical protein
VGVLGPSRINLVEIVGQSGLQGVKHLGAVTSDSTEVTDIKDNRVVTTGEVFRHGTGGILQRHLPATEGDDFRAEFDV